MCLGKMKPGKIAWKSNNKMDEPIITKRNVRRLLKKIKKNK
jgi:hypothetical protein